MPAPGDQHKAVANPYLEPQPRISQWTAEQIATISAKLDKQLGPEYISSRAGPGGGRVHYLTSEKVISLANEVFGFQGWSSSIQNIQVDFADENPQTGRVSLGLSVIVRVTLRDGTYHEDIGYGSIENAKNKAMAFEKAKKEGTTDGMKRALRNFGNVLGNCIYDKEYVSQVTKIRAQPARKFDPANLLRIGDYVKEESSRPPAVSVASVPAVTLPTPAPTRASAPVPAAAAAGNLKLEPGESFDDFLGELDEADFCVAEDGHPDEIMIPALSNEKNGPAPQLPGPAATSGNLPSNTVSRPPQTPNLQQSRTRQSYPQPNRPLPGQPSKTPGTNPQQSANPGVGVQPQDYNGPVAFFSARAVNSIPEVSGAGQGSSQLPIPQGQHLFNPKAESPSIRKTPGIDHSSSKPLARNGQHVPPSASQQATGSGSPATNNTSSFTPVRPSIPNQAARGNIMNPSLDQARRIGAPIRPGSPLSNRGSYKAPSMKRNLPTDGTARTPLAELPVGGNGAEVATTTGSTDVDAKRQKVV